VYIVAQCNAGHEITTANVQSKIGKAVTKLAKTSKTLSNESTEAIRITFV